MKTTHRLLTFTLLATSLLFTACNKDDITNTNNSIEEQIAKKDFVFIIKGTPAKICKSKTFLKAIDQAIQHIKTDKAEIKIKKLRSDVQKNSVSCSTYIPSDIRDLIDPICREKELENIIEEYDIPDEVNLSATIDTSCVVSADENIL